MQVTTVLAFLFDLASLTAVGTVNQNLSDWQALTVKYYVPVVS